MSAILDRLSAPGSTFQTRFFFLANRFVAGETIDSALEAVAELNAQGRTATLDFLGEDVVEPSEAERTRDTYLEMLDRIAASGARTNVSVKLTALGLSIDEDACVAHLTRIVERASHAPDPFVRIDMEGSALTERTLRVAERVFGERGDVGPVLQAYLRRTPSDVERAIERGMRVRLCKGAYREPETLALHDMPEIRRTYLRLAEALLTRGVYPGIATHDARVIDAVKAFARARSVPNDAFEFQLLYGVRPDLQRRLVDEGYNVRVYVPFGTHWAGYFYRRITERPENAVFALRSVVQR